MDPLLVRRSQRGLALTDAGKEYLLSCKRALRVLREGREAIERVGAFIRQRLYPD